MKLLGHDPAMYVDYLKKISLCDGDNSCSFRGDKKFLAESIARLDSYLEIPKKNETYDVYDIYLVAHEVKKKPYIKKLNNYLDAFDSIEYDYNGNAVGVFVELLRSINYWIMAVNQNDDWWSQNNCGQFADIQYARLFVSKDGHFYTRFRQKLFIPLSINGKPSFVLEGYRLSN